VIGTFSAFQVTIQTKKKILEERKTEKLKKKYPSHYLSTSAPHTNLLTSSLLISMCFELFLSVIVSITFVFTDCALFRIYFHKMSQNGYSFNDNVSHRYFISKKKKILKKKIYIYIPKQRRWWNKKNKSRKRRRQENFLNSTGTFSDSP